MSRDSSADADDVITLATVQLNNPGEVGAPQSSDSGADADDVITLATVQLNRMNLGEVGAPRSRDRHIDRPAITKRNRDDVIAVIANAVGANEDSEGTATLNGSCRRGITAEIKGHERLVHDRLRFTPVAPLYTGPVDTADVLNRCAEGEACGDLPAEVEEAPRTP